MSVLESMRSSSDSTFMQVLLVLITVSFVGWMALPQADTTVAVAKVNGVSIMDTQYRQLYSSEKGQRERQLDRPLTEAEEASVSEQVRQQLIRNEVLLQEAAKMGLVASHLELKWEIFRTGQYTGYVDADGKMDNEKYERYLSRRGLTRGAFETQLMDGLLIQKIQQMVFMGTTISEPVLKKLFEQNQRKVALTYARIRPSAFFSSIEVSDEQISTWLKENAEEAQKIYERDFDRRYKHPLRLDLGMIRLRAQASEKPADLLPKMTEIRASLLGGAEFESVAKRWSEDPSAMQGGNMGLKPVMKLDVAVTDAVEGVAVGDITRVVAGDNDVRIYKVLQRIEASEDSFEEASRSIATEAIRKSEAPVMAVDFSKKVLAQWKADGKPPIDLLEGKGLSTQTTRLMAAADPPAPFGPPPEATSKGLELPEGAVLDNPLTSQDGNYWVVQVAQRVDADMAQFEAQRETIRNQQLVSRRNQFLESWVTDRVAAASVE